MRICRPSGIKTAAVGPVLAVVAALAAAGCASMAINTAFDPNADFDHYRTYAWTETGEFRNPATKARLLAAVDRQLQAKSLVPAGGKADLHVAMHARLTREAPPAADGTGWDYGWGTWATIGDLSTGLSATHAPVVPVGSIFIDLVDASRKELVWRGVASRPFDTEISADEEKALFDEAMQKLFARFPPQKK